MARNGARCALVSRDMPNVDAIGRIIHEHRLALRLNMADAARRAGVSRSTWYALETGKRTATLAGTLDAIDAVLELAPGTLRAIATDSPVPATNVGAMRHRLAAHAETLTPANLASVLAFIESPDDAGAPARALLEQLDALRERVASTVGVEP